jgi:uncharacterized protein Yka (UPF0111/DUF47 family)
LHYIIYHVYEGGLFRLKSIKGIFVVGEKNIFNDLAQLVDIALEANVLLGKMFKMNPTDSELTKPLRAVQMLQKKASEVGFKINEDITGGAISPNVIDSLLKCDTLIGDVVHTCLHISRELDRMAIAYSAGLEMHHADWDSVFANMLELIEKSLSKLRQALLSSDMAEIFRLHNEIQALEEQGDDMKDQGFDRLYGIAPQLNYLEFYHYQKMLHNCEDILNACSDFASLIVSVVTSILK